MYNNIIKDCFFSPLHVGELDSTQLRTVSFSTVHYSAKDIIELFMHCDECYYVEALCFKTNGNPYQIAALEYVCRTSVTKKLDDILIDTNELQMQLEIPLHQTPVLFSIQIAFKKLVHLMNIKRKGEL